MKVKLIFNYATIAKIKEYYQAKGTPKPDDFNGPEFDNVVDTNYDRQFYSLGLLDGTVYRYSINSIDRVKEYQ